MVFLLIAGMDYSKAFRSYFTPSLPPSLPQGLTHLGKGTLTLNPFHSDRLLMSPVAVAGLLVVQVAMLDASNRTSQQPDSH